MGEFATAKTSVWWDIENCGVPRSCDPERIVQNMSSALATAGYSGPISVSAYGDTGGIPNRVQHALSSTGVTLNHVPAGIKDASDKRILVDMLFWAIDNPPPANYLLISGDRDFSNAIHKLKMRRYNILLAQPPNVSQTLSTAAKSIWLWKSLVAGEPPLAQSPYINSTSSGNIDDLDISKSIVSNSLDTTPHTNPQMQNCFPCDHQSGSNVNTDKQCEVKQPREKQSDRVVKPANKKDLKRSNSVGIGFTTQLAFKKSKKSKGGSCTAEHSKPPMVVPQYSRPVPGQGLICFKCGDGHRASKCTFEGDCEHCGVWGHNSRVCKSNPDCIIKWEPKPPKRARIRVVSSPGLVHTMAAAPASQLPPAASSPGSVHMTAAAPASQLSPAASSPGSVHMTAAAPASQLSPAASSPGSVHMTAAAPASQLSPAASSPGSVHMTAASPASQLSPAASSPGSVHMMAAPPASQLPSVASSPGSVHMMAAAPASQLPPAWIPPPGYFWQMAPTVPSPPPAPPVAPAALQPGIGASSAPAHSGVYAVPTTAPLGKAEVVTPPTSSAPCPPTVVPAFRPVPGQSMLCFKCGGGHRATECTWTGHCRHCRRQGHMWRVCRENPDSIIKWEPAPSHVLSASSQALCFKCGGGHRATECTWTGHCRHCRRQGHMWRVCRENPNSIIKWEPAPSHVLSASSQAPVHMMSLFPASQLPAGWTPSPGWFWQAALAMRPPLSGLPLASAPPQPGVAVSFAPSHSGVYALPTPTSLGRPDMVAGIHPVNSVVALCFGRPRGGTEG